MESPAADAVSFNCAAPVPESGESVSQLVVEFAGETAAVQEGDPPVKLRLTVAEALCEEPAGRVTDAGVAEAAAPAAAVARVVDAEALTVSVGNSANVPDRLRLFAPVAVLSLQHSVPSSLPKGPRVVVPKICCNWLLRCVPPDANVDNSTS